MTRFRVTKGEDFGVGNYKRRQAKTMKKCKEQNINEIRISSSGKHTLAYKVKFVLGVWSENGERVEKLPSIRQKVFETTSRVISLLFEIS